MLVLVLGFWPAGPISSLSAACFRRAMGGIRNKRSDRNDDADADAITTPVLTTVWNSISRWCLCLRDYFFLYECADKYSRIRSSIGSRCQARRERWRGLRSACWFGAIISYGLLAYVRAAGKRSWHTQEFWPTMREHSCTRFEGIQQQRHTGPVSAQSGPKKEVDHAAAADHKISICVVRFLYQPCDRAGLGFSSKVDKKPRYTCGTVPKLAFAEYAVGLQIDIAQTAKPVTLTQIVIPDVDRVAPQRLACDIGEPAVTG